jgi:hypothetical protein
LRICTGRFVLQNFVRYQQSKIGRLVWDVESNARATSNEAVES